MGDLTNVFWSDVSQFLQQHLGGCIGGLMVCGIFSRPLSGVEMMLSLYHCIFTAYLSIPVNHVYPIIPTVYPSSDDHLQQNNAPCQEERLTILCVGWYRKCPLSMQYEAFNFYIHTPMSTSGSMWSKCLGQDQGWRKAYSVQ